jgi:cytochrome c-type biogenesis protein CcmH/NrfG
MPARFCAHCGTKIVAGAKFCTECGTPVGRAAEAAGRPPGWQMTIAGASVLVVFLGAGLAVWTWILAPGGPRPGPAGPGPRTVAAPAPPPAEQQPAKVEIPAEVKSFIADLTTKAKGKPNDVDAWLKLAQVNGRAAQLDPAYQQDAMGAFEHVLDLEPQNAEALRGLANVHYDRDDHQKAIPLYEKYLALRPDDASARTDLATMYLYSGQAERAIAMYKDVIRDNPSFVQAHYNLAVTYHGQGDDTAALKELDVARGLATEDGVRKQIDDMIASLKAMPPGGTAPVAPTAAATAPPDGTRAPFQGAVEQAFRASPIMGGRIVRFEWTSPSSGRVLVRNFPMEAMPAEVREKFTTRLAQEVRTARESHPVDGAIRLEITDADSGKLMAAVSP